MISSISACLITIAPLTVRRNTEHDRERKRNQLVVEVFIFAFLFRHNSNASMASLWKSTLRRSTALIISADTGCLLPLLLPPLPLPSISAALSPGLRGAGGGRYSSASDGRSKLSNRTWMQTERIRGTTHQYSLRRPPCAMRLRRCTPEEGESQTVEDDTSTLPQAAILKSTCALQR